MTLEFLVMGHQVSSKFGSHHACKVLYLVKITPVFLKNKILVFFPGINQKGTSELTLNGEFIRCGLTKNSAAHVK